MADLFSDEWMKSYMDAWNNEPELSDALAEIDFNSVIGYGFPGDDSPTGVMTCLLYTSDAADDLLQV